PVRHDTSETIYKDLVSRAKSAADPRLLLCFPVPIPQNFKETEVRDLLEKQGYTRFFEPADRNGTNTDKVQAAAAPAPAKTAAKKRGRKGAVAAAPAKQKILEVVQDRFRASSAERGRVIESLEAALRVGRGRVNIHVVDDSDPPKSLEVWRYSSE